MNAQVPYIKWRRTLHTVGLPHPWIPNRRLKILFLTRGRMNPQKQNPGIQSANCIFIEENLRISGPAQFKPVLFKEL